MDRSHSDREISDLLVRACHDLRAAARVVRTHSELLVRDAGAPRTSGLEQRLGFVVKGTMRIEMLLDGLAAYSSALETDAASFQSVRTDILLRTVLMKLSQELRDGGAEVVCTELPAVNCNFDRLMQVFENLIRNALVHRGEAAPRIHIGASRHGEDWLFAVQDNGPGVDPDSLENIFKPFERMQSGDRPGAGMGLAICRAIVERHGGRIWAESQAGNGATFLFTLPAV